MSPSNPVLEAIQNRRSIRRYTADPVSKEAVRAILEAARWAPTGKNNQAGRYLVLTPGDARKAALTALSKHPKILEQAQAVIVAFLDREACYDTTKDHQGSGAAIQNILLAVHSLGLGAVWVADIMVHAPKIYEIFGLDGKRYEFMAAVAIGHPAEQGSPNRQPLEDFMLEPF